MYAKPLVMQDIMVSKLLFINALAVKPIVNNVLVLGLANALLAILIFIYNKLWAKIMEIVYHQLLVH